jgi:hypothetical protein
VAVDTLDQSAGVVVTPADGQDRAQVAALAEQLQAATGDMVEVAFADAGYGGDQAAQDAEAHGNFK